MRKYIIGVVVGVLLSSVGLVLAGDINSPAGHTDAGGQMYTLEQIYDRLSGNGNATKMTSFTEPTSGPGSTMHTLDEIYELAWPACVPKTGQTTSSATGDDGDLEKGIAWPSPRFTDNSNGTVTDNLTGLIWLKNANCADGTATWANALAYSNALFDGCSDCFNDHGDCGLSDGSSAGDWRLPNVRELHSLIDYSQYSPALPSGYSTYFTGVQWSSYWSSTTDASVTDFAWYVYLDDGFVKSGYKDDGSYVWPVRGGQ